MKQLEKTKTIDIALAAALALALVSAGGAAFGRTAPSQSARDLARHGVWVVAVTEPPEPPACFATAKPKSSKPEAAERGQPYVYVSTWPRDGIKAEVSVVGGTNFKPGSSVALTIGTASFMLFTADDRAFVADPTSELKLIDAMKKGSSMLVEGIAADGTQVSDVYSLGGLAQALTALVKTCG